MSEPIDGQEVLRAARRGDVEWLRNSGCDLLAEYGTYGTFVWQAALETDQDEVLKLCLQASLSPNGTRKYLLIKEAIDEGADNCIELLLQSGADLSLESEEGDSVLFVALWAERFDLAELALERGANPFVYNLRRLAANRTEKLWRTIRVYQRQYRREHAPHHEAIRQVLQGNTRLSLTAEQAQETLYSYKRTTLLHLAATKNRSVALESILDAGADVNHRNSCYQSRVDRRGDCIIHSGVYGGCTPLMLAAEREAEDAVRVLLGRGADLEACDSAGNTPLHMACRTKNLRIVQDLVTAGANVNARMADGCTPLILATAFSLPTMVEFLLNAGADISASDNEGFTALLQAAWVGRAETARLLLSRGAQVCALANGWCVRPWRDGDFWEALTDDRRTATMRVLLPHLDCNAPNRKCSPLLTAVRNQHWAAVPLMVEAGARLYEGESAGVMSRARGKRQPLQQARALAALAKIGQLPSPADYQQAVEEDLKPVVKRMAQLGCNPSHGLHYAKGLDMLDLLISLGADVNQPNESGELPLQSAIKSGNLEVVKRLRKLGAEPLARDAEGHSAVDVAQLAPKPLKLMFVAFTPNPAAVATLRLRESLRGKKPPGLSDVERWIQDGANVNLVVEPGITALTAALGFRAWAVADALLAAGAKATWESDTLTTVRQIVETRSSQWQADVDLTTQLIGATPKLFTEAQGAVLYSMDRQVEVRAAELVLAGEEKSAAESQAREEVCQELVQEINLEVNQSWCGVWRPTYSYRDQILLVEGRNPYAAIALFQFHGHRIGFVAIRFMAFLRQWEHLDWKLTGIVGRTLELKLEKFPEDMVTWFKELRSICPGMIGYRDEEIDFWNENARESGFIYVHID